MPSVLREREEDEVLKRLNPAQREAVSTTEGPLLVLAGAGTGKTRVITCRIAHLLRLGTPAASILAVTFTNKAAREMRERVSELLGSRPRGLTISTFHSLGSGILRAEAESLGLRPEFSIQDEADQLSLLRTVLRDIAGTAAGIEPRTLLAAVSRAKNCLKSPEDLVDEAEDDYDYLVARVYKRYQEGLRSLNCVDFDDLILLPVKLLESADDVRLRYQERFRYLLVDEYQDTNGAQYRFTLALVGPERNVCVVGDDDQSIYSFRGADLDKILRFERDFPGAKVVRLEENYRSSAAILRLANAVIAASPRRHRKTLRTSLEEGPAVEWTLAEDADAEVDAVVRRIVEFHDVERLAYPDIAVLLRSSLQARGFEEKLRLRRIPYRLVGGQSYFDRKEVRDALAYFKAAANPSDDMSVLRILNTPRRGFGAASVEALDKLARGAKLSLRAALESVAAGAGDLPARARQGAKDLAASWRAAEEHLVRGTFHEMCARLLDDVGYRAAVAELYPDPVTAGVRWNAVADLLAAVKRWQESQPGESFAAFLAALALDAQDNDRNEDKEAPRGVWLMTIHSAKGLEFPAVFLPGLEEDILPHRRSIDEGDAAVEEERRIFYVGITRARRQLLLITAMRRVTWGQDRDRVPSRFLTELEDPRLLLRSEYRMPRETAPEELQNILSAYKGTKRPGGGDRD